MRNRLIFFVTNLLSHSVMKIDWYKCVNGLTWGRHFKKSKLSVMYSLRSELRVSKHAQISISVKQRENSWALDIKHLVPSCSCCMPETLTNLFVCLQESHDAVWFTFMLTFVLFVIEKLKLPESTECKPRRVIGFGYLCLQLYFCASSFCLSCTQKLLNHSCMLMRRCRFSMFDSSGKS